MLLSNCSLPEWNDAAWAPCLVRAWGAEQAMLGGARWPRCSTVEEAMASARSNAGKPSDPNKLQTPGRRTAKA